MAINYTLKKSYMKAGGSDGKYYPKAVTMQRVTMEQIEREIEHNCSAKISDVRLVLTELNEVIARHLKDGCRIDLGSLGILHPTIQGSCVDSPEDFSPRTHINKVTYTLKPRYRRQPTDGPGKVRLVSDLLEGCQLKRMDE